MTPAHPTSTIGIAEHVRADHGGDDPVAAAHALLANALRCGHQPGSRGTLTTAAVTAFSLLHDTHPYPALVEPSTWGIGSASHAWSPQLARVLDEFVTVLTHLDAHQAADDVSRRAIELADRHGSRVERITPRVSRIRLLVAWAFHRETTAATCLSAGTAGQPGQAPLDEAAHIVDTLINDDYAVGPQVADPDVLHTAGIAPLLHAVRQLHRPHVDLHGDRFHHRAAPASPSLIDDRIIIAIATARRLRADGDPDGALVHLGHHRSALPHLSSGHREDVRSESRTAIPGLALALHREYAITALAAAPTSSASEAAGTGSAQARVTGGGSAAEGLLDEPAAWRITADATIHYAAALEHELRALRADRLATLQAHTALHAAAQEAFRDPLTGLPNRRALCQRLAEALSTTDSQPCTVAVIDLDRFKTVNDTLSHAAGDDVLREIANCLRATLRASGHSADTVARYGGDEFAVVLPTTPLPTAVTALRRVSEAVAALPHHISAGVTLSVGVAPLNPNTDVDAALAAADAAMYRAKRAGGNTVCTTASRTAGPVVFGMPHAALSAWCSVEPDRPG